MKKAFFFFSLFLFFSNFSTAKDSARFSLGAGIFNYMEDGTPPHNIQSTMINFEIHSGRKMFNLIKPFAGFLGTTENAYYNFFVKHDIKIDLLHIDAGHSYDDVKRDFELYSKLLSKNGIITIHDTDKNYSKELIKTDSENFTDWNGPIKFIEEISNEWQKLDLFNSNIDRDKPSSTGLTILKHA